MEGYHASDVEIMVHVTAPGLVADDETYRQLAQANLAFRPEFRENLSRLQMEDTGGSDTTDNRQEEEGVIDPPQSASPRPELLVPPSFYDSQDLSFNGAWDNRTSPRLRADYSHHRCHARVSTPERKVDNTREPWRTPSSEISDSYPLPAGPNIYISPTRIIQQYLPRKTSSFVPAPPVHSGQHAPASECAKDRIDVPSSFPVPLQDEATGQPEQSQIIPVTPAAAREKDATKVTAAQEETTLGMDVTHISSSNISLPSTHPTSRSEFEPAPARRSHKAGTPAVTQPPSRLIQSSSDTGVVPSSSFAAEALEAVEVRSPSPPVGVEFLGVESFVTDALAIFNPLSGRYKPEMVREVLPLERGYWLVDCSTWSQRVRNKAWSYLYAYIRKGLAGWGVWCRRDERFTTLRLYCWGHILKHAYLLLYTLAGPELKVAGAVWIDGGGEVAVLVRPCKSEEEGAKGASL